MTLGSIVVVAGATGTGKTSAAIALAQKLDGELVGADSVQVYRGFDIGSAKPRATELSGIPHHLIDVVNPDDDIDAVRYARLADAAIASIFSRGRTPIVVGGTGLWIRALLRGLLDLPPVDDALRQRLEHQAETLGPSVLHDRLRSVDPVTAGSVHPNDTFRTIRALEVHEQTGRPLGELRTMHALGRPRYHTVFIVVEMERAEHDDVITSRIDTMLEAGWIAEVQSLRARWGDDVRAFGSVGYRDVLAHVRDGVPIDETRRRIRKSTRTYARRQRTWFKREPGVSWRTTASSLRLDETAGRIAEELRA